MEQKNVHIPFKTKGKGEARGEEKKRKTQHCVFWWGFEGNENGSKASLSEQEAIQ